MSKTPQVAAIKLPLAPSRYDPEDQDRTRHLIEDVILQLQQQGLLNGPGIVIDQTSSGQTVISTTAAKAATGSGPVPGFGWDGDDGDMGPPGLPGLTGPKGSTGLAGATIPGLDGEDGSDGQMGPPGLPGSAGTVGPAGAAGPQGSPGLDGVPEEVAHDILMGLPSSVALLSALGVLPVSTIPSLPASIVTTGQLLAARGGTGIDSSGVTNGQLLIGQTSDHTFGLATLGSDGSVTITNAGHSISLSVNAVPGSGLPYMYPFGDAIIDNVNDNFRGSSIDTGGTRFSGAGAWTALNIGASNVTVSLGKLWLQVPADNNSGTPRNLRGYYQPVPSGNWRIRIQVGIRPGGTDTTQKSVGMFLRDSTGGKLEAFAIGYSGGNPIIWAQKWTTATSFSATRTSTTVTGFQSPGYIEIEYDGTNYYYRFGYQDGPTYLQTTAYQFAKTNFLAAAADGIGVYAENDQNVQTTLICGGFYRVPVSTVL
jgi:hypothetical protein